jgi:hypothetical protein
MHSSLFYADSKSVDRKAKKNKLLAKSGEKWSFPALITVCLRFFHTNKQKKIFKHFRDN